MKKILFPLKEQNKYKNIPRAETIKFFLENAAVDRRGDQGLLREVIQIHRRKHQGVAGKI